MLHSVDLESPWFSDAFRFWLAGRGGGASDKRPSATLDNERVAEQSPGKVKGDARGISGRWRHGMFSFSSFLTPGSGLILCSNLILGFFATLSAMAESDAVQSMSGFQSCIGKEANTKGRNTSDVGDDGR